MLAALLGFSLLGQQKPFDFYQHGPYISGVPRPETVLGYTAGAKHTTFRDQERVIMSITGAAKDRTEVIQYGKSTEGRPLKIVAISSKANMDRLDDIRRDLQTIADGKGTDALIKRTPPVVWINECIHGNEPASFESAMWLIYNLSASNNPRITALLQNVVVVVNPVFNPDGHERFAVWYGSVGMAHADPDAFEHREPSVIGGRTNHYRFDMNRDHLAVSQDETRQELAEYLRWNPQVYVDQHGQVDSYFFPPNPMSINTNVDRNRLNKWTDIFGRATAAEFDKSGWLYFVKDTFDFFAPVYTDTWSGLSGAIGMTHETEGWKSLKMEREDGSIWMFRDSIAKHFTSAIAVASSAASRREDLVRSYSDFKSKVVSGQHAGKFKRVVVTGHPKQLQRLANQLDRSGIESRFVQATFHQTDAHDYWTDKVENLQVHPGALVIDMAQPQGALAKSFLEPVVDFEPEFIKEQLERRKKATGDETYPRPEGSEFYDLTGWSLPYAHNLKAWWSSSTPVFSAATDHPGDALAPTAGTVGWAWAYAEEDDLLAAADLLARGVRVQFSAREMRIGGATHTRGTFLVLLARNEEDVHPDIAAVAKKRGVRFTGIDTSYPDEGREGPGSGAVVSVKPPSIGVVFGDRAWTSSFGSPWYLMEREFNLPFAPITASALGGDLSKYTCVVLPAGQYAVSDKLKEWVSGGGCLVLLGNIGWATGERGFVKLEQTKGLNDKEPGYVPGSIFRAQLDPRSFLSFGYEAKGEEPITFAVPVEGSTFYKTVKTGGGAVRLSDDAKVTKLLTGWVWPEDTEKALTGTVWLHDQPVGRGHVIMFTQDPTERAMWPGLYKLLLNAMVLGPSF
jgi:hypothetical protein